MTLDPQPHRATAPARPPARPGRLPVANLPLSLLLLALLVVLGACVSPRAPSPPEPRVIEQGLASWYGPKFHGRLTANGEIYDMHGMTAAHKKLPFGTLVEVRNLDNGRAVRVRINDRGPFIRGRVIDLSYAAAQVLGLVGPGVARVELALVPEAALAPPTRRWAVQLGAFEDAARAERFRARLAEDGIDASVRTDGTWHRVHVGSFGRREEADQERRRLDRLGWTALVVRVPAATGRVAAGG